MNLIKHSNYALCSWRLTSAMWEYLGFLWDQPLEYPYNISSLNVGIRRDAPSPLLAPDLRAVRKIKYKMSFYIKKGLLYSDISIKQE